MMRIAIALLAVLCAATAGPSAAAAQAAPRPTVVLVHGAWGDSAGWRGVVERLQRQGHRVAAPANPLRGLASDAAYLRSYLGTIRGPVVLAGHSYGGAVISNAAVGSPNVAALVYVSAFIPDEGETVAQLTAARPGSVLAGNPSAVFDFAPYPGAPEGDADLYVKRPLFRSAFADDLRPALARTLAASQKALALGAVLEPSGPPAWRALPSWALVGTRDRVIPPAQQVAMARRAGARVTRVRMSHLSPLSHPRAVARIVSAAARATPAAPSAR